MSLRDKLILERTSTKVFIDEEYGVDYLKIGTDELEGNDYRESNWYNMGNRMVILDEQTIFCVGEYLKDLDQILMPQDPLLKNKIPRPLMERGHCQGIWSDLEQSWVGNPRQTEENIYNFLFIHMNSNTKGDDTYKNRDCTDNDGYLQPLSKHTSKVLQNLI